MLTWVLTTLLLSSIFPFTIILWNSWFWCTTSLLQKQGEEWEEKKKSCKVPSYSFFFFFFERPFVFLIALTFSLSFFLRQFNIWASCNRNWRVLSKNQSGFNAMEKKKREQKIACSTNQETETNDLLVWSFLFLSSFSWEDIFFLICCFLFSFIDLL